MRQIKWAALFRACLSRLQCRSGRRFYPIGGIAGSGTVQSAEKFFRKTALSIKRIIEHSVSLLDVVGLALLAGTPAAFLTASSASNVSPSLHVGTVSENRATQGLSN